METTRFAKIFRGWLHFVWEQAAEIQTLRCGSILGTYISVVSMRFRVKLEGIRLAKHAAGVNRAIRPTAGAVLLLGAVICG